MPCERKHVEAILNQLTAIPDTGDGMSWVAYDNTMEAVLAALAACDESPLRSMESAPKDGSSVILLVDGVAQEGGWLSGADQGAEDDACAGWWSTRATGNEPTHWMPLPAAQEVKP